MSNTLKEKEEFFTSLPLFESLDSSDLEDVLLFAEPFSLEANSLLFRQGQVAEGLYFIGEGKVRLFGDVPGSDVIELGTLGFGDLVGEISLLDRNLRLTSAVTLEKTSGYFLSTLQFEMLRSSIKASALKVMNSIRRKICARIRSSIAELAGAFTPTDTNATLDGAVEPNKDQFDITTSPITVELPVLQSIPLLQAFTVSELEEFLAPMQQLELRRGDILYTEGSPADRCFITVRGAVRSSIFISGRYGHLALYAPSRIVGFLPLLDGGTHPTTCAVREQTILFEITKSYFEDLAKGNKDIGFKFLHAVNQELALDMRRIIRQFTRLASQS